MSMEEDDLTIVKLPALKGGGSALRQCFAAGSKPAKIRI